MNYISLKTSLNWAGGGKAVNWGVPEYLRGQVHHHLVWALSMWALLGASARVKMSGKATDLRDRGRWTMSVLVRNSRQWLGQLLSRREL